MTWKEQFEALICDRGLGGQGLVEAQALKEEHLPQALFKYCDTDHLERRLAILRSGNVWLSDPQDFNDPLDCVAAFDVEDVFQQISESPAESRRASHLVRMIRGQSRLGLTELRDPLVADVKNGCRKVTDATAKVATRKLRENLGVTCFAETPHSAPM